MPLFASDSETFAFVHSNSSSGSSIKSLECAEARIARSTASGYGCMVAASN